jgi:predicted Zn-dependent protease
MTMRVGILLIRGIFGLLVASLCLAPTSQAHRGIDEQIQTITSEIVKDPQDATLYLRRGELHRIHREWDKAEADYLKARELDSDLAAVEYCLGRMKLQAGRPAEAKPALERYLAQRPDDPKGWVAQGRALAKLGEQLAAAEAFTRALAHSDPVNQRPEYFLERAQALEAAGTTHYDEALRGLDEGLEQLGQPVVLQSLAIELEIELGRYDKALARLESLAARSPRKESWLVRKAEILESAGRTELAREAYSQSLNAIAELPDSRQNNKAVEQLEARARTALQRLDEP